MKCSTYKIFVFYCFFTTCSCSIIQKFCYCGTCSGSPQWYSFIDFMIYKNFKYIFCNFKTSVLGVCIYLWGGKLIFINFTNQLPFMRFYCWNVYWKHLSLSALDNSLKFSSSNSWNRSICENFPLENCLQYGNLMPHQRFDILSRVCQSLN